MTEFWVMRVAMANAGHVLVRQLPSHLIQAIGDGRMQLINGDLCEPIECYEDADEERAQRQAAERATAEHARTGCVHKVVANIDLPG